MSEIVDCIAWIVRKTCWTFYVFCEFVFLRILDLFGLIFNVLACFTVIRLPCMIRQFRMMEKIAEWRYVGFVQLVIFVMDIPFILMGLTVIVFSFGLVSFRMTRDIKEKRIKCDYTHQNSSGIFYGGFKLRKLVATYFFKHMSGLLCIPLLLITLLSWRSLILVRKLRPHTYFDWEWRKEIVLQFLQLFVDIPCVFVAVFVVLSWRLPFYIRQVKKVQREERGWSIWRFVAFEHFFLLFVDLFCFMLFAITLFSWRSPFLIVEIRDNSHGQWEARWIVVQQFLLIFVDLPCILCFILVLITLWRLPRFIENFENDQWEIRRNCVYQAGMLVVDFACFLLFSVVVITIWRLYPLARDIRKYRKRAGLTDTETADTGNVSRPSSWKIRKAICKHFGLLLVDLPAIVVLVFIFLTVFRVPSLVSKLLQSGDFYAEFAMIVFIEAGKLLIDIVFLLFFVVLMILRPTASWVRLLEDEEHARYRHIRFFIKWIPDMIRETRTKLPVAMEEEFSSCLKERVPAVRARVRMSLVCRQCLKQWEWLHGKVVQNDAYPELAHLITSQMWYEKRRPYKMSRLYSCELLYLSKPVPTVHDETLLKHQREMVAYEDRVASAYRELENFAPLKVPLWSNKCGLLTRTRRETQKVLLGLPGGNIFLFLLILMNLLLVYRGPRLILDLYHRWYNRRSIILRSCKEYLLDALTFLRILIVLLLVYRAPALLLDIAIDVFQKQSWKAVRSTVERYPPAILEDFTSLLSKVFHWRSVRYLFTAILFGILIPADLLLTVLKLSLSKGVAIVIAGALFLAYLVFPFAFSFYFGEQLLNDGKSDEILFIIGGFCFSIVVVLALLILILLKNRSQGMVFSVAPKPYDYVRLNWANAHVIVFEILELLQLLALVFSINNIPMVGSDNLNTYANYLLFNFASFEVKLSLTVVGFLIWFIACGAPIIFEQILEEFPKGRCAANDGWRLLMVLFSNTLFVSVVEGLCGLVACTYTDNVCINNGTSYENSTCYMSSLVDDTSIKCWVGEHRVIALFGFGGLFWYSTTSLIYGTQYGEVDSPNVDIEFSPVYNTIVNFLKAVMVGAVVLVQDFTVVTTTLFILGLLAIFVTIFFKRLVGYVSCNSVVMSYFRVASFVVFIFTVIAAFVAKRLNNKDSYVPLFVFFAGGGSALLIAFVASLLRRRETATEKERKLFRQTLLTLEKRLGKEGALVKSWKGQKQKWRRLVRHVYQAQELDRNVSPEIWERVSPPEANVYSETYPPPPPVPKRLHAPDFNPGPPRVGPPPTTAKYVDAEEPSVQITIKDDTGSATFEISASSSVADEAASAKVDDSFSGADETATGKINASSSDTNGATTAEVNESTLDANEPTTSRFDTLMSDADQAIALDQNQEIYDADQFLNKEKWQVELEENNTNETITMADLQCNGKNVLLFFEGFVHFRAFSFSFVSQIPFWREAVRGSNWTGLLHCLQVLEKALTGNYDKPTELDVHLADNSVPTCVLVPDPDQGVPPSFVPEPRDPESIRNQSDSEREKALRDIELLCGEEPTWLAVFEKVLPTIPVIRRWRLEKESNSFELVLRRSCQATVVDVGPKGIKLAKGASIALPKNVKGVLTNQRLTFSKRFEPVGKKGPISVTVSEIEIARVSQKVYLYSNGKKINAEKALDSLKSLKWS